MSHDIVLVGLADSSRPARCLVALLLCAAFAACAPFVAPRTPNLLTTKGNHHAYSWDDFEKDRAAYDVGVRQGDKAGTATATYYRDRMLWSVVADVNWTYYRFRNEFHGLRSTGKTAADIAKLGMSAASTVLGGSAVLSGAVTALEGSQLSFEKNFLEEKTTEMLLTTMDALREERMADIQRKMVLPPPAYSFEEAYADALALFSAGTVPSALERISAEAGKQERDAQAERTNATQLRVIATLPETTAGAVEQKVKLNQILSDLRNRGDAQTLKSILTARSVPIPPNASVADLSRLVFSELRSARSPAEIDKMVSQLKTLGIWKE